MQKLKSISSYWHLLCINVKEFIAAHSGLAQCVGSSMWPEHLKHNIGCEYKSSKNTFWQQVPLYIVKQRYEIFKKKYEIRLTKFSRRFSWNMRIKFGAKVLVQGFFHTKKMCSHIELSLRKHLNVRRTSCTVSY